MTLPTATLLAELSEIAYARPRESSSRWQSRVIEDCAQLGVENVRFVDSAEVQAFVGDYGESDRITVYRGTDSHAELLTNLFASFTQTPVGRVHRKFRQDVETMFNRIRGVDYFAGDRRDWFTGHSRGGACAAIMACLVESMKRKRGRVSMPTFLVTHEMPRAGGAEFARTLRRTVPHVRRWQVAGDLVPLVPLWPFFRHDVPPSYFDSNGKLREAASMWTRIFEYPAAVFKHFRVHWFRRGLAGTDLHNMTALRKMIDKEESEHPLGNLIETQL